MDNNYTPYNYGADSPEPAENPAADRGTQVFLYRKKLKSCCNNASGMALLWLALNIAVSMVLAIAASIVLSTKVMVANPDLDAAETTALALEEYTAFAATPMFLAVTSLIVVLLAGIGAFAFGNSVAKNKIGGGYFLKSRLSAKYVVLGGFALLGVQMLSLLVQTLVMNLTGYTGYDESLTSTLSFGDDLLTNVIIAVYVIIAAPILEELMYRGAAMKLLSPVNKTFALVATSLLFGLMHTNFNQIFNGILVGPVFGYIALKSGSIKPSIILHMVCNIHGLLIDVLGQKLGDTGMTVYCLIVMVIGLVGGYFLVKSLGAPSDQDGYPYTPEIVLEGEEKKGLTWKLLLTSPTFWIFAVICLLFALTGITPLDS